MKDKVPFSLGYSICSGSVFLAHCLHHGILLIGLEFTSWELHEIVHKSVVSLHNLWKNKEGLIHSFLKYKTYNCKNLSSCI